jgi:glycyl-tRNA synthetase beta chain
MNKPLLIEIGVEELPAIPLLKELNNIPKKWDTICSEYNLKSDFKFYYTPRRLIFSHPDFASKQADIEEELFGPPVAIAYKDGEPTKACESFAKKAGIEISQIQTIEKKGKEVLYARVTQKGLESTTLLQEMLNKLLDSLKFGKTMRWGESSESFIRPIRWIVALFDKEVVPVTLYNVTSSNYTFAHRIFSYDKQEIPLATQYLEFLDARGVTADQENRRTKILKDFSTIEKDENITIEIDNDLLDEIIAITEQPSAYFGSFDEIFLNVPDEVIITSMKEHQRYFPVFKDGKLSNHFIVVANVEAKDANKIIAGNEKVLRARLADALFFWENDKKRGLINDGLENVTFADGLGSLADKTIREQVIAKQLCHDLKKADNELLSNLTEAVSLSKTDLLTEMVYEFTELQGVMGYYYALEMGKNPAIAIAIKEQYMPLGEDSELPTSDTGALMSLATKLDTLLGLFSVGKIPTGSKDPFALRRMASGIIKIIIDRDYHIEMNELLHSITNQYNNCDIKQIQNFMNDRLVKILNVNPSLIAAVLATGESDYSNIAQKVKVLESFVQREDFSDILSTFKRVANITKDLDLSKLVKVNKCFFEEEAEMKLLEAFEAFEAIEESEPAALLEALAKIKPTLDDFFDKVMVNADNPHVKKNRQTLVGSIYARFLEVGDIKEISI